MRNTRKHSERRRRLAQLDRLLTELEWLNLADRTDIPEHLATRLETFGIRSAARQRPPQLIEAVFDLQRPFLRPNPAEIAAQATVSKRLHKVEGWVFV